VTGGHFPFSANGRWGSDGAGLTRIRVRQMVERLTPNSAAISCGAGGVEAGEFAEVARLVDGELGVPGSAGGQREP
jgi:hypothetical protein